MKRHVIVFVVVFVATISACSTEPSVRVPPDAPTPLCSDVPACEHTLCRADEDPGYCTCDGVRCLRDVP